VSFPQLYFSRTSYAEVVGQLFVLSLLYALVTYWQTRRHAYLLLALAALTAAFAARIDFILVVPTLHLFLVLLALRRDWKATALVLLGAAVTAAFTVWTMNQPYTGATAEIVLGGHLSSTGSSRIDRMAGKPHVRTVARAPLSLGACRPRGRWR
jgi:predicted membrane-bound mannosyltransferase